MTLTYSASAVFHRPLHPNRVSSSHVILNAMTTTPFIHFLLRSCDFNVSGIVYATVATIGRAMDGWTPSCDREQHVHQGFWLQRQLALGEGFIENAVDAYARCYDNLKVHHPDYPNPTYLKSIIRYGNIYFEGDYSKIRHQSNLIKQCILDDVPGKLYVTVWGGASTVARALKSIEEQYRNDSDWKQMKDKSAINLLFVWHWIKMEHIRAIFSRFGLMSIYIARQQYGTYD